ncbi:MAG: hypothetical protein IT427_15145 [Pirellulales bacterium]|nr:hypothetical protein [Pirellulales bacterium]
MMQHFIRGLFSVVAIGCWEACLIADGHEAANQPRSPLQFVQFIPRQPQRPRLHSHTDKGIVSAVAEDSISVVSDNKVWVLRPQPGCVIEVIGRAEPSYLASGQIVRLYGEFDKKHKSAEPIKQLEIVSPTMANVTLGIFPETLPPQDEAAKTKKPATEKPNAENTQTADPNAHGKAPENIVTPTMIVGTLKLVKDGELLISAAGRAIRVHLAEAPEIRVSLSDFTLAKRSDAVKKFSCDYIEPGAGYLKLLQIELTDPLEGAKKPTRRPAAKPVAKQPKVASGKSK